MNLNETFEATLLMYSGLHVRADLAGGAASNQEHDEFPIFRRE